VRLEGVTAELRPRSDWEAVDLGLALVRRDFWRLFASWWLGMLPVLALSPLLLRDYPVLLVLLCWWWMPVGSRLVLFVLSRRLFGELPRWKEIFRELPRACVRRFGFRMLWARFSPWRPLTMAVEDLEGLRGKDYAQRVRLLLRRGDATVVMLALWRAALTGWLALSVFFTAMMFLPAGQAEEWKALLDAWKDDSWGEIPAAVGWLGLISLLLSMSLVDVFSTGAGFGIYVNHRTWIEGWDVELAFRRLGNRLRGAGAALLGLLLAFGMTPVAEAEVEAGPKETIEQVKAHEDFTVHSVEERVPKTRNPSSWSWGDVSWLAGIAQALMWLVLGAFVAFVVWLIWRYRHLLRGSGSVGAKRVPPPQVRVVMGMEVAPESLPPDIPAAAMELWRVGRRQEAMSLLYRGTISRLIATGGVEIAESDTESDCLRRVAAEAAAHAGYFSGLTETWMRLAYGRSAPPDEAMQELCASWPFAEGRAR
jgi:hypothetical protein